MKSENRNDKTAHQNMKLKKVSSRDKGQLEAIMIMYDTQKRWEKSCLKKRLCTFHIKLFWINYNQNKILASINETSFL